MTTLVHLAVLAVSLAVSAGLGVPLVGSLLAHVRKKTSSRVVRPEELAGSDASASRDEPALPVAPPLRGGLWIGVLERLAVTGAVLVGFPSAITAVVALKALGRFSEIRDDIFASEAFIIGSLASLLWAGTVGFAAEYLLASL